MRNLRPVEVRVQGNSIFWVEFKPTGNEVKPTEVHSILIAEFSAKFRKHRRCRRQHDLIWLVLEPSTLQHGTYKKSSIAHLSNFRSM